MEWQSGGGSGSLHGSLTTEQVVRYTSPGFVTLYEVLDSRISIETAISTFRDMRRTQRLDNHVDPSGVGYIEVGIANSLITLMTKLTMALGSSAVSEALSIRYCVRIIEAVCSRVRNESRTSRATVR